MKSILIVAPKSNLDNMGDLMAASRGFEVNVLSGFVNSREVLRELAANKYQIVHFSSHCEDDALAMSDGRLEEARIERVLLAASVTELVIFNTCSSVAMAAELYRSGAVPRAIAWSGEVSDDQAIEWVGLFYEGLANPDADYWQAYESANEVMAARYSGFEQPIYLNGRIVLIEEQMQDIRQRLDQLSGRMILPAHVILAGVLALIVMATLLTEKLIAP